MRHSLARLKREAAAAAWPAVLAAVLGPMLVALVPGLRSVAAEYLPPGPERLLMMAGSSPSVRKSSAAMSSSFGFPASSPG